MKELKKLLMLGRGETSGFVFPTRSRSSIRNEAVGAVDECRVEELAVLIAGAGSTGGGGFSTATATGTIPGRKTEI